MPARPTDVYFYCSCSVVLFAVRAIVQLIFFTPKASPFDPTRNQPFVGTIFASNLFCMISHIFFTQLEAGEETRGYLHGGLFIDFIGQKAPIPLLRLLAFDVLIMFLDFIMLGLIIERVKTNEAVASISTPTSAPPETPTPAQAPQDHDSEERGILREASQSIHGDEGVELQDLGTQATNPRTSLDEQLERTGLLIDDSAEARSAKGGHFLDTFAAGEAVIMETSLIDIIRDQWRYSATTATTTRRPVPYNETAAFLRERFGLQVRPDGRLERIEQ